jgi:hypothetical protein
VPSNGRCQSERYLLAESPGEVQHAPVPTDEGEGRGHPRFYFRTLATATIHPLPVLGTEKQECYVLTRDLSRGGISFLHPKKLIPGQQVDLAFEDGKELFAQVQWTKRLAPRCFLLGCRIVAAPERTCNSRR